MKAFSKFNQGFNFLLLVIDIFSKYGWIIPLKNKEGKTVASALKTIFKERKPEQMWVDKGKEFYNKDVKELIELYSTENEEKSSVVERWIRTMKEKMWKYFTDNNTNHYVDILPDLVKDYNNTRSSIKMGVLGLFLNSPKSQIVRTREFSDLSKRFKIASAPHHFNYCNWVILQFL